MAQTVFLGDHELTYPGPHLGMLRDCNAVLDSAEGLHQQIAEDGYLLVRGLIDREKVIAGRRAILEYADDGGKDDVFKPGTDIMEAFAGEGRPGRTMGTPAVTHHPDVQAVLEGDELFKFSETSSVAIPEHLITNGSGLSDPPPGRDRISILSIWEGDQSNCIPVGSRSVMYPRRWEHWLCWPVRTISPVSRRFEIPMAEQM